MMMRVLKIMLFNEFFWKYPMKGITDLVAKFFIWMMPGEVYTTEELQTLLLNLQQVKGVKGVEGKARKNGNPKLFAGFRDCPCRQALCQMEDDPFLNKTDIIFHYSNDAQEHKLYGKQFQYLPVDQLVQRVKDYHDLGFIHAIYGCFSAEGFSLAICNCNPDICIPLLAMKMKNIQTLLPPHNLSHHVQNTCQTISQCGKCLEFCPFDAIHKNGNREYPIVDADKCMGCGLCKSMCPTQSFEIQRIPGAKVFYFGSKWIKPRGK